MKVAVIGTGYVGLVTGTCLANTGNTVICADKDQSKIDTLNDGGVPIYEEGLAELIERNVEADRLFFTTDTADAIQKSDVVFIAVGTPPDEDGSADLRHVLAVARDIGHNLNGYKVVVCKSTVPVGTCDKVAETISAITDADFDVVSNPEFLKEGTALKDFQSPDRVVIGATSNRAADMVAELYRAFMRRSERIVFMDVRSAEMTKYASNAMLATKISFINEIATLCDAVGADVELVRKGMSLDERIGPHFIFPGVGYGGSCFPKDVQALARLGKAYKTDTAILDAVEDVNACQKMRLLEKAMDHFQGDLKGKRLAVWGLSFKPRTDDVREAPALLNIRKFVEAGATVLATDPVAMPNSQAALADLGNHVVFNEDNYAILEGADALFVFTEWEEFRNPDFPRMLELMASPVVFDGRNIFRPHRVRDLGFKYYGIGRP